MTSTAFNQIQRRGWVFGFNVSIALFTWAFSAASTALVLFTVLLLAGIVADLLESRVAIVLNPLLHNAPIWLALYLSLTPGPGGEAAYFNMVGLVVLSIPCLFASGFTAFLYWRDLKEGDY